MTMAERLGVVLCWHMHQPAYRTALGGSYRMPWTYLHAIKDYVDMAAHLEAVPGARAVVNFTPVLLDQLTDYAAQIEGFLRGEGSISDPVLAALGEARAPESPAVRAALIRAALRSNEARLIDRFPPYKRLCEIAFDAMARSEEAYLSDQFLADLVVWYHLAWLGETVRSSDAAVERLLQTARGFSLEDRRELLGIVGDLIAGIVPRYRALGASGCIELAMSPYAHPILPLMLDIASAREALPGSALPDLPHGYPGGADSARWQIDHGLAVFERHFGFRPCGCWPSEGALSEATLELLEGAGFAWTASGEGVLRHSLGEASTARDKHAPFRLREGGIRVFFRADALSDDIGFNFAGWHADDAVGHLVAKLEDIAAACEAPGERVVAIIMDGENAWEHYPENAYHFLSALYERLGAHPRLELTTFAECVARNLPARTLGRLVAGSWVYGTLSTWAGHADKNRAWEMLADAKRAFMSAERGGALAGERLALASRQLAVCEGSDWFWWLGDANPGESIAAFDALFREQLRALYELLGETVPVSLAQPISTASGAEVETGGVMRRATAGAEPGA